MKNKIAFAFILLVSCKPENQYVAIENQMKRYEEFIKTNEPDSIASLYLPQGTLSGEGQKAIESPDSIRKFLKQFNDFHVLNYTFKIDSSKIDGDHATAKGTYVQRVVIPQGDTLELGGSYSFEWVYSNQKWLINNLHTFNYNNLKQPIK